MNFKGKVTRRLYASGSKSERVGVMIETSEGEFRLQRIGGNPFRDDTMEALIGKYIQCEGTQKGNTLFIASWEEIENP
jgi:hypothetical protein